MTKTYHDLILGNRKYRAYSSWYYEMFLENTQGLSIEYSLEMAEKCRSAYFSNTEVPALVKQQNLVTFLRALRTSG